MSGGTEAKSPRLKPLIKASDIGGSSAHVTNQEGRREGGSVGGGGQGRRGERWLTNKPRPPYSSPQGQV